MRTCFVGNTAPSHAPEEECHGSRLARITPPPAFFARKQQVFVRAGQEAVPTVDCFTWGGVVKLCHADEAVLDADYAVIEGLCLDGLWAWA